MTDLEQIKQKVDIVSLVSDYVALKKTGANYKGLCPFHNEKTPSFVVSPERQIWHCFGGCNDGGDIFKFLMKIENIEFPEALKILADRAGVKLTESFQKSKNSEIRERIFAANKLAAQYFEFVLLSHPTGKPARKYLEERKISEDSIKLFGIGYAPNSWSSLSTFLAKKGFTQKELEVAGLVSRSGIGNYFDRFRGRVVFSIHDHRGNVVGFSGRVLNPDAKEAKYVNSSETPVYTKGDQLYGLDVTKEDIKKSGFAIVVEGQIDAIQSYQSGERNIVAMTGSALTSGQIALLKRYTEQVYLSLDSDFAGDAAAHRGIEMADAAGLSIKVVTFSGGKDPDELIKKDPALWREAIKNAVSFYDFVITSALAKFDAKDPQGAKKIVTDVAKFLAPIENLVVKSHYIKKLAAKLDVSEDDLETQIQKDYRKAYSPTRVDSNEENKPSKNRSTLLEEYLLAIIIQSPNPSDYLILIAPRLLPEDFTEPTLGKIYQLLWSLVSNPKSDVVMPTQEFEVKHFVKALPEELLPTFDRLYLSETGLNLEEDQNVLEEIQKTAWDIKELSLRSKLRKIGEEIKKQPESDDLAGTFQETTTQLQKLLEEKGLISTSA